MTEPTLYQFQNDKPWITDQKSWYAQNDYLVLSSLGSSLLVDLVHCLVVLNLLLGSHTQKYPV